MKNKRENTTKMIVNVAMGREQADLVIKNVAIVNTNTREINKNMDIAIKGGRICLIGCADKTITDETKIIDGTGLFATPGLMDGHIHIESSMLSLTEYAKVVMKNGTTAIFHDPHEIANVLGTKGVDIMLKQGENVPLRTFCTMPSCVPAVSEFEVPANIINSYDTNEYLKNDDIIGLGEMMDMFGVVDCDDEVHSKLQGTLAQNKTITGHFCIPNYDALNAYIGAGVSCCHESTTGEEILQKLRLGMYVQMREGSAWQDLESLVPTLVESDIDTRFVTLISDDTHPNTLLEQGHMNHIVKKAVSLGIDPIEAVQMATINTANCFNVQNDFGSISPGKVADIALFKDLKDFECKCTIIDGEIIFDGKECIEMPKYEFENFELNTMKLNKTFEANDFLIKADIDYGKIKVNVIEIIEVRANNNHVVLEMNVENGVVDADVSKDILKASCIDRHNNIDQKGLGFVKGFNIKNGAVASTIAHDTHNINVIGTNDEDMAFAVNELEKSGGGIVVVCDRKVIAKLELSIAGLMSVKDIETVSKELEQVEKGFEKIGCNIRSPFMTMALLSLAVIPSLRLTNKGLVDTNSFEFIGLFAD